MIRILFLTTLFFSSTFYAKTIGDLLQNYKLDSSQFKIDGTDLNQFASESFVPSLLLPLLTDPFKIPSYAQVFRETTLDQIDKPYDTLVSALAKVRLGIRRSLYGNPFEGIKQNAAKNGFIFQQIQVLYKMKGLAVPAQLQHQIESDLKKMPEVFKTQVGYLLGTIVDSLQWRKKALDDFPTKDLKALYAEIMATPKLESEEDLNGTSKVFQNSKNINLEDLAIGGIDLSIMVSDLIKELPKLKLQTQFLVQWQTPYGEIVFNNLKKDDVYLEKPYLVIIDFNGNDTYYSGGGSFDLDRPVSLIFDLNGNDKYLGASEFQTIPVSKSKLRKQKTVHPSFGSGVFGYGFLIDFSGDDLYRSIRHTQAQASFGVGMLIDLAGNDRYDCYVQCQGSADFGAGVLVDHGGKDEYHIFQQGQGFGGVRGAGFLIDAGKDDDVFDANIEVADFPSMVDKKTNVSFAQGASCGIRADSTNGHSLAGGFGMLFDGGGNNHFKAGFFTQGVGYWMGLGFLLSGDGNDTYEAEKYAQGAGTHFAVGVLDDKGGNDSYRVTQELGLGEGHDFSVGFFLDEAGDDTYRGHNLTFGCGSANGSGIFWDQSGDDNYNSTEKEAFGCASPRFAPPSLRSTMKTTGLFLDTGGKNKFETQIDIPKGNVSSDHWLRSGNYEKEIGFGFVGSEPGLKSE
jgi:hypothetical protein